MRFPDFRGDEPCTQIGDVFTRDRLEPDELTVMVQACTRCRMLSECSEWAMAHEPHHFWAGLTAEQRRQERRRRGLLVHEPTVSLTVGEVRGRATA